MAEQKTSPLDRRPCRDGCGVDVIDPTLFSSTDILDHTLAARLCDVCPVRVACREATEETAKHRPDLLHGTYAGRRFGGA